MLPILLLEFQHGSTPHGSRKCRWSNKRKWFIGKSGEKSLKRRHFLIGNLSFYTILTHKYRKTTVNLHGHTNEHCNTHTKQAVVWEEQQLISSKHCCDQSSNEICSSFWTGRHMEAVAQWLRPALKMEPAGNQKHYLDLSGVWPSSGVTAKKIRQTCPSLLHLKTVTFIKTEQ